MASLAERLRVRSEHKPRYNIDDSDDDFDLDFVDKKQSVSTTYSRRTKTKRKQLSDSDDDDDYDEDEASCNACGNYDNLLNCETCTNSYHPKCLMPPLKGPLPRSWRCPQCVGPFNDVEKILDCEMRPTVTDDTHAPKHGSDQVLVKQYLVKWKGQSYLHCTWVPETEFTNAYKSNPRLRTKINNFYKQTPSTNNQEDEFVAIRPEWTTVDRIIACREGEEEKEYLVKWNELSYDECYWELESDIASFHKEIERFNKLHSQRGNASVIKQISNVQDAMESKKKHKEFQQFDSSPDFLSGGSLHPYQLEGLNFLRFAWSNQTHVILADEMGLGKTIQSIAFLASLFEENVGPHLVVAPLSTLRNWEREFSIWAPHMNVVMYVGSAQARSVIREYEFYYPKTEKSIKKKKKSAHGVRENRNDRIKFDVLLTSYEMINFESSSLKPIKWECMIVDEGHRLKNKDSKLFSMLTKYSSAHRILLTGTPLQNNLDELFMLMHFLDAGKFASLEEFQNEFKDINQEEQISRLHKMLAPHLLRRVKKDVMKELPPKRELILRVDMSSKQKEYYKAILTRNYEILARKGGAQISLINVVMELRKLCCHPFMLEGVEPDDPNEFNKQLLEISGKLQLLDKMMVKLKEQGHRVLIYSQFQHMLDLLEDYCTYRKWHYERIDGRVGGAERQIRIDRFNANNSSKFCFLLSTRAGGLGINLATADTVIIYDSDWNPHADLQAMARAHRLGQTKKVMIFRLITRGTIEERMMQMTKKKMVLEHLVVGKLKTQNINQEELDDIIRYGSKELFEDESDELVKSRQIHYDDAAIDCLLNRDQVVDEDASSNEEEEHGFLKAFKVANFEYVDEAELVAEEEPPVQPTENATSANTSERLSYWEDLLRDKYQVHKTEEFSTMGKGRRSRKQMTSIGEDDAANVEDVSSGGRDDSYEAELTDESNDDDDEFTDSDAASTGAAAAKKTYKRKAREVSKVPLMEGEGKSLRVLGFNQRERATFLKILMRFGVGEYDWWAEFVPHLKLKTKKEINKYGELFLEHLTEQINDSPTFKDGVPKEGLRVGDVLVRMATMTNIQDKVKDSTDGSVHFADDILARNPQLKGGKHWKQSHDLLLLQAILKHGYGRWQAIAEDKDLGLQDVICQQLLIPTPGTTQPNSGVETSQVQPSTVGIPQTHGGNENGIGGATGSTGSVAQDQLYRDYKMMQSLREVQRRQVEFIKKRVLLLEKGLNAQLAKTFYGDGQQAYNMPNAETETGHKFEGFCHPIPEGFVSQIISQLPQADPIFSAEISAIAIDGNPDRLKTASLYNEMNKVITNCPQDSLEACLTNKPRFNLGSSSAAMEVINQEMMQIFSPEHSSPLPATDTEGQKAKVENLSSSLANDGGFKFVFGASVGIDMGSSAMDTDSAVENASKDVQMKEEQDLFGSNIDAPNDGFGQ